jgi:hypothetical protein
MELGVAGYLLVFMARVGLVVALLRARRILRAANEGGMAGLALAYALLVIVGRLTFDHVWAAINFVGIGLILRAALQVAPQLGVPLAPQKGPRSASRPRLRALPDAPSPP